MADISFYNEATGYSIAESIQSEEGEEREGEEGAICMQRLELAVQAGGCSSGRSRSKSGLLYSNDSLRIQRVNMSSETSGWSYGTMWPASSISRYRNKPAPPSRVTACVEPARLPFDLKGRSLAFWYLAALDQSRARVHARLPLERLGGQPSLPLAGGGGSDSRLTCCCT